MPNRWVREDAIESESVNAASWLAEVFWRRLLNRCDDFGRFTANLTLLRTKIFPLQMDKVSEADLARLLSECEAVGLLFTYKGGDGKPYLVMNKWEQGRAKNPKYPDPPPDVCKRMQTFVYRCTHTQANAPTSDPDFRLPTSDPDCRGGGSHSEFFPELKDVLEYANGAVGIPKDCAEAFWNEMEACGWRDSKQRPIGKWRNALNVYAMRWRANNNKPKQAFAARPPTQTELFKQRDAIESQLNALRNKHGEGPLAKPWSEEDRQRRDELKKRIREVNEQIAKGAQ